MKSYQRYMKQTVFYFFAHKLSVNTLDREYITINALSSHMKETISLYTAVQLYSRECLLKRMSEPNIGI